ncbi:MAG: DUF6472 family protein [Oscillospiraceae bacterium]|nr:DUF6472 family protein [Oscillospiraceae bacterium]
MDCDTCAHCVWDDDEEDYVCIVSFDEDEAASFYASGSFTCPYYSLDDEYGIVRKQM